MNVKIRQIKDTLCSRDIIIMVSEKARGVRGFYELAIQKKYFGDDDYAVGTIKTNKRGSGLVREILNALTNELQNQANLMGNCITHDAMFVTEIGKGSLPHIYREKGYVENDVNTFTRVYQPLSIQTFK